MDKNMGKMLDRIYEDLAYNDDGFKALGSRVDGMIDGTVREFEGKADRRLLEDLSENFALAAAYAEKGGYCLGLKHAVRLLVEALTD